MGSDLTDIPKKGAELVKKSTREILRVPGQIAAEARRSDLPGVSEVGRVGEKVVGEIDRLNESEVLESIREVAIVVAAAVIAAPALAKAGIAVKSAVGLGKTVLGAASAVGGAVLSGVKTVAGVPGIGAVAPLASALFAPKGFQASPLATVQSTGTVATRIQSEARSATADLRARLNRAGSRAGSNRKVSQLNTLPGPQGPQLVGQLG